MIEYLEWLGIIFATVFVVFFTVVLIVITGKTIKERDDFRDVKEVGIPASASLIPNVDYSPELREQIAQEFDHLASQCNPEDPEGSALYSLWAMNAADRIRHPERYSGMAQGGSNVLHEVPTDGS